MRYVYKKAWVRLAMAVFDSLGGLGRIFRTWSAPQQSPKKICFVILHQIGDLVLCLPALAAVAAACPEAELSVIAGSIPAKLLEGNKMNLKVYEFDAAWQKVVKSQIGNSASAMPPTQGLLGLIDSIDPEVILVFHPDLQVNRLLGRQNRRRVFAFANAGGGFFVSDPVPMPEQGQQALRNFALAQAFCRTYGVPEPEFQVPQLRLESAPIGKSFAAAVGKEIEPYKDRLVVLHPFASAETKNWAWSNWRAVIDWLQQEGWQAVVIGSSRDQLPDCSAINLCGRLSLRETYYLLGQARFFLGVDSGPGHIAAAAGCPMISVFSSVNDPDRWAPMGEPEQVQVFHALPLDRQKYPLEMRNLPEGVKENPYTAGVSFGAVIQALQIRLGRSAKSV